MTMSHIHPSNLTHLPDPFHSGLDAEKYERDECDLGSGGALAITAVVLTFITSIIGCFIRPDKEHYV